MLQHIGLHELCWDGLMAFMQEEMVPKYKDLMNGKFTEDEVCDDEVCDDEDGAFFVVLETLLQSVTENPKKVYITKNI